MSLLIIIPNPEYEENLLLYSNRTYHGLDPYQRMKLQSLVRDFNMLQSSSSRQEPVRIHLYLQHQCRSWWLLWLNGSWALIKKRGHPSFRLDYNQLTILIYNMQISFSKIPADLWRFEHLSTKIFGIG